MNNLRTPPLSSCKNLPPYFFMVHLLHRLYGVDAPGVEEKYDTRCYFNVRSKANMSQPNYRTETTKKC